MSSYLPDTYSPFRNGHPEVASALDAVGFAVDGAGPLDARTRRLVGLALAIGAGAEGAVRPSVREATTEGAGEAEIRQVALAATTTARFPACVAGLSWIDDVVGS